MAFHGTATSFHYYRIAQWKCHGAAYEIARVFMWASRTAMGLWAFMAVPMHCHGLHGTDWRGLHDIAT